MKTILIIIFFSSLTQGQTVLLVDPDIDPAELQRDFRIERPVEYTSLPSKQSRDKLFKGIKSVQKLDELDKDILYKDLHKKSLSELVKKYPYIPKIDLQFMLQGREE